MEVTVEKTEVEAIIMEVVTVEVGGKIMEQ